METYDKAKWHTDGAFPPDLEEDRAFVFAGMFLAWAIDRDRVSDAVPAKIVNAVKSRKMSGARAYAALGGVFEREQLSVTGRRFADAYVARDIFAKDYVDVLAKKLPTTYHVEDSWPNYERIAKRIDERFGEWREKNPLKAKKAKGNAAPATPATLSAPAQSRIKRLQAAAKKGGGDIEVENLLGLATTGDPGAAPLLRALSAEYGWGAWGLGRDRRIPFGRWVEHICGYLEGGIARLVALALDPEEHAKDRARKGPVGDFAFSVLMVVETPESLRAVLDIIEAPGAATLKAELAKGATDALQELGEVQHTAKDAQRARRFLHDRIAMKLPPAELAAVLDALVSFGDEESLAKMKTIELRAPWERTVKATTGALSKRLKQAGAGGGD